MHILPAVPQQFAPRFPVTPRFVQSSGDSGPEAVQCLLAGNLEASHSTSKPFRHGVTHGSPPLLAFVLREQECFTLGPHPLYVVEQPEFYQVGVDRHTPTARLVLESTSSCEVRC